MLAAWTAVAALSLSAPGRFDLGDFSLKAGAVTFNNFYLKEAGPDERTTGFAPLTVRGSFRNPGRERLAYTVVVYGVAADGGVEWACHLSGVAEGEDVGMLDGQVPVLPGALKRTPTVKVKVRVGPAPALGTALPSVVPPAPFNTPVGRY